MVSEKHLSHLRAYRRRWGLSQRELAYLLGRKSTGAVYRLERSRGQPSIDVTMGIFVIFGTDLSDLFPGLFDQVETDVMERLWELYESLQGTPSQKARMKIELLEDAIERAKQRNASRL